MKHTGEVLDYRYYCNCPQYYNTTQHNQHNTGKVFDHHPTTVVLNTRLLYLSNIHQVVMMPARYRLRTTLQPLTFQVWYVFHGLNHTRTNYIMIYTAYSFFFFVAPRDMVESLPLHQSVASEEAAPAAGISMVQAGVYPKSDDFIVVRVLHVKKKKSRA